MTNFANQAKDKDALILNKDLKTNNSLVEKGDIFLIRVSDGNWSHTGIVIGRGGIKLETIEGNTNSECSTNGNYVYRRSASSCRDFSTKIIDIISLKKLQGT